MVEIPATTKLVLPSAIGENHQLMAKAAVVAAIFAVDTIWILGSDFQFHMQSMLTVIGITVVLAAVAWFYRTKRPMERFEVLCSETAILLAFSAAAAVLSLLMTSLDMPLIDDKLIAADAALGFDWLAYVGFVNERPWLGALSSAVYVTSLSQVALTVVVLGLMGRSERVQRFVLAVMLGALICIAISAVLPAAGALATIRPPVEFVTKNQPIVDLDYKQAFFDLRSGAARFISLDEPRGVIAFPSYHATLSALIVLAFFRVRGWFWPLFALNFAVVLATPIDGGHHLVDALGGIVVAFVAWGLAQKFLVARRVAFARGGDTGR
ncbi:phosphatase PAP2 family protein [Aminobacter sp. HY435]|uniref:phosphatase PAP2 family protein n=1 Tax=Aminobacter sp. HY435 TaxID=2970917 RepID=UPI0022B98106|nr:phosphatase PAP2 family protein [Aminobacter sp. HY435]